MSDSRIGSLCSGIGGLDLGVSWATGASTAWFCEREPAPRLVLERHGVPIYDDLTATDWAAVEPVDILTAGYPCQPFSLAGQRKGTNDERHLWPYVADAVRVLRPGRVFLENVAGHLTLGFGDVLGDLARLGYDAQWGCFRASDVGAPHRRTRVFIAARNTNVLPRVSTEHGHCRASSEQTGIAGHARRLTRATGDTDGATLGAEQISISGGAGAVVARQHGEPTADTDGGRCESHTRQHGAQAHATEADDQHRNEPAGRGDDRRRPDMGRYETAVRRWEAIHGPAPAPLDGRRLSPRFVEWMMGFPTGWVDGLTRAQALKALGNAVVPHVAALAWLELAE